MADGDNDMAGSLHFTHAFTSSVPTSFTPVSPPPRSHEPTVPCQPLGASPGRPSSHPVLAGAARSASTRPRFPSKRAASLPLGRRRCPAWPCRPSLLPHRLRRQEGCLRRHRTGGPGALHWAAAPPSSHCPVRSPLAGAVRLWPVAWPASTRPRLPSPRLPPAMVWGGCRNGGCVPPHPRLWIAARGA